eukprot:2171221-Rhodomonas_salina.3
MDAVPQKWMQNQHKGKHTCHVSDMDADPGRTERYVSTGHAQRGLGQEHVQRSTMITRHRCPGSSAHSVEDKEAQHDTRMLYLGRSVIDTEHFEMRTVHAPSLVPHATSVLMDA